MQGFNMGRYVPPEHEGRTSANKLHGKKPPGFHGDKQTVRFEMPFNVFCLHCEGHIAQGVRFNAEKKKIGSYFSTPIFSFRMRHVVCAGTIEIQTDPKNTAYVVTEGAKKKAADEEPGVGIIKVAADPAAEDPFARKEKDVTDKTEAKQGAARIAELKELSARQWADPYEHSRKMRKVFRAERKVLQTKAAATEALRDRAGLSIELLDELPEDAQRAKLVEFEPDAGEDVETRPLFLETSRAKNTSGDATRDKLQKSLQRNTRVVMDPFLTQERPRPALQLKNLKRKAAGPEAGVPSPEKNDGAAKSEADEKDESEPAVAALGLEGYDSDD